MEGKRPVFRASHTIPSANSRETVAADIMPLLVQCPSPSTYAFKKASTTGLGAENNSAGRRLCLDPVPQRLSKNSAAVALLTTTASVVCRLDRYGSTPNTFDTS